jgi:hypothetical protein
MTMTQFNVVQILTTMHLYIVTTYADPCFCNEDLWDQLRQCKNYM